MERYLINWQVSKVLWNVKYLFVFNVYFMSENSLWNTVFLKIN